MDTVEKLFLYRETIHLESNDENTVSYNKIFEVILNRDSHLTST